MTVEIRELVIKATVRRPGGEKQAEGKGAPADNQEIIADCVEEVMRILRDQKER
jgi:hypothetical protein